MCKVDINHNMRMAYAKGWGSDDGKRLFDEAISAYFPIALASMRRYAKGDEDRSMDMAQEAILQIIDKIDSWNPRRGDFIPWALVVVHNKGKTIARGISRHAQRYTSEADIDGVSAALATQKAVAMERKVVAAQAVEKIIGGSIEGGLNKDNLAVLFHTSVAGVSSAELAQEMGVPDATIRSRKRLARTQMRATAARLGFFK